MIKNFELYLAEKPVATGDSCVDPLIFSWHMENINVTLGDPAGCSQNADKSITLNGMELSTTQKSDGTYSLYRATNTADAAGFTLTGMSLSQGSVTFDLYVTVNSSISAHTVWYIYDAGNNDRLFFSLTTDQKFRLTHTANGSDQICTTAAFSVNTWYSCAVYYRQAASPYLSITCGALTATNTVGINNYSDAPVTLVFGSDASTSSRYYVDNMKIYNVYNP